MPSDSTNLRHRFHDVLDVRRLRISKVDDHEYRAAVIRASDRVAAVLAARQQPVPPPVPPSAPQTGKAEALHVAAGRFRHAGGRAG
jgi:hypothetical protein